jgi:putative membrane protein
MPSDRRFHPLTVLFSLGGELRNFLLPVILATMTASRGRSVQSWFLIFLLPGFVMAAGRYWFSTYRYDETELVVRTGIFFKNERHIPYTRIQSVDAVQNVLHRFFGVVDVKVQTGTGGEAEATLSVLPLSALAEMRERVFEGKRASGVTDTVDAAVPLAGERIVAGASVAPVATESILALGPGELALSGILDNRGWVVIGALTGLVWESGVSDRIEELSSVSDGSSWKVVAAVAAGLFVVSPILSLVWAVIRLHGFTLSKRGTDLGIEYGAFTRVTATIPLRRVQTVRIKRGIGHLWCGRAAVRVETAGGTGGKPGSGAEREWIAPIIPVAALNAFLQHILPSVSLGDVEWHPVDPRAFGRRARVGALVMLALGAASSPWTGWWALALTPVLMVIAIVAARQHVRGLGWAHDDGAMYFRSGWLRRTITIVPLPKIQCVELVESPFDRRFAMAQVNVDAAGAGAEAIEVPYLPRIVAEALRTTLATHAATTEYRW